MTTYALILAMFISFGLIFSHKVAFHYGRLLGIRQLWSELNKELIRVEQLTPTEEKVSIYENKP